MKHVLFVADMFSDQNRTKTDLFPGGAERTDEAAIEACPHPVICTTWKELTEKKVEDAFLIIVGNSGSGKLKDFLLLEKHAKHILFEHDLRICHWRGSFPVSWEPLHRFGKRCSCPHRTLLPLFNSALGIIYLTKLQKSYYDINPFYEKNRPTAILGSSLFDTEFLEYVDTIVIPKKKATLIPGTKTKIKGSKIAEKRCIEENWEYSKIINLKPKEVWEAMLHAERLVYLPLGLEAAGRMPVEARLLGCKTITNENVGVTGEAIWKLDDDAFKEKLGKQAHYFWKLVSDFFPEFED